jgi:hypothetical protein
MGLINSDPLHGGFNMSTSCCPDGIEILFSWALWLIRSDVLFTVLVCFLVEIFEIRNLFMGKVEHFTPVKLRMKRLQIVKLLSFTRISSS